MWVTVPVTGQVVGPDTLVYEYTFTFDDASAFEQQGSPDNPTIYWLGVNHSFDLDGDGAIDAGEGDPNDPADDVDSDGDGLSDATEGDLGTDPLDPNDTPQLPATGYAGRLALMGLVAAADRQAPTDLAVEAPGWYGKVHVFHGSASGIPDTDLAAGELSDTTIVSAGGGELGSSVRFGDVNADGTINPVDVVFLVNHVYRNWPLPPC